MAVSHKRSQVSGGGGGIRLGAEPGRMLSARSKASVMLSTRPRRSSTSPTQTHAAAIDRSSVSAADAAARAASNSAWRKWKCQARFGCVQPAQEVHCWQVE